MSASDRKRILVVEDEPLVAMLLEDMLADLGFEVVGPAMRVEEALFLLEVETVDAALLDVNLGCSRSYPAAERLTTMDVPFAFATGYGAEGTEWCDDVLILRKPFEEKALTAALADLLDH